jgi:GNAT superfamily N-acetyltransferase
MAITVREVTNRKQFAAFIDLPYRLYKDNNYFVPPLRFDEIATLRKDKNPAFDYCEAKYWLAYKDGRVAGRVAGIVNQAYIQKWKNPYMRFGWIDFEDDEEVVRMLLGQVEAWAKEKGLTAVHGPLGFTDLDHEGMLIEGYDQLGTLATIYNFPYYAQLVEKLGYKKDIDWVEYKIKLPQSIPDKVVKIASIVQRRLGLHPLYARNAKEILPYAGELFELINTSYSDLYGVVPLTKKQIVNYTKQYFSFIRPDFVSLILDKDGKLAAFGITMPSLSLALQKAKGRLFPFGFIHILSALKKNKLGDLYLVAVRKDLQGKGVNAMLMAELTKSYIKNGIEYAESNPELETNTQVQALWEYYEARQHKRRRCFIKLL